MTDLGVWGLVGPRGAIEFEDDDGNHWLWARCHIGGCPNGVCTWLSNTLCHPHSLPKAKLQCVKEESGQ
jgi:hypothetical protein